jgi:hypothetical protein
VGFELLKGQRLGQKRPAWKREGAILAVIFKGCAWFYQFWARQQANRVADPISQAPATLTSARLTRLSGSQILQISLAAASVWSGSHF